MVKDGKVRIEDTETASEGSITIFDSAKGLPLVVAGGVRGEDFPFGPGGGKLWP